MPSARLAGKILVIALTFVAIASLATACDSAAQRGSDVLATLGVCPSADIDEPMIGPYDESCIMGFFPGSILPEIEGYRRISTKLGVPSRPYRATTFYGPGDSFDEKRAVEFRIVRPGLDGPIGATETEVLGGIPVEVSMTPALTYFWDTGAWHYLLTGPGLEELSRGDIEALIADTVREPT